MADQIPPLPKGFTPIEESEAPPLPKGFTAIDETVKKKDLTTPTGGKESTTGSLPVGIAAPTTSKVEDYGFPGAKEFSDYSIPNVSPITPKEKELDLQDLMREKLDQANAVQDVLPQEDKGAEFEERQRVLKERNKKVDQAKIYLRNQGDIIHNSEAAKEGFKNTLDALGLNEKEITNVIDAAEKQGEDKAVNDWVKKKLENTLPVGFTPQSKDALANRLMANRLMKEQDLVSGLEILSADQRRLYDINNELEELNKKQNKSATDLSKIAELRKSRYEIDSSFKPLYDGKTGKALESAGINPEDYATQTEAKANQYKETYKDKLASAYTDAAHKYQYYREKFTPELAALTTGTAEYTTSDIEDIKAGIAKPRGADFERKRKEALALRDKYLGAKQEFDAMAQAYLVNTDPSGEIKGTASHFFKTGGKALLDAIVPEDIFPYGEPAAMNDPDGRKFSQAFNAALQDKNIPLTEAQKEQAKTSFGESVAEGLGGLVGILPKLAIAKNVFGVASEFAGLATFVQRLEQGTKLEQIGAKLINAGIEETSMQAAGLAPGAGAGFALSHNLLGNVGLKLKGPVGAIVQPFVNKVIGGAIGGTAGMETASALEGTIEGLKYNKTISEELDKRFPSLSEVGKRLASEFIVNGVFGMGQAAFSKADRTINVEKLNKLADELYKSGNKAEAEQVKKKANQIAGVNEESVKLAKSEIQGKGTEQFIVPKNVTQAEIEKIAQKVKDNEEFSDREDQIVEALPQQVDVALKRIGEEPLTKTETQGAEAEPTLTPEQEAALEITTPLEENVGQMVNYEGVEGVLQKDKEGNLFVHAEDGSEVLVEGGLSGKPASELGVRFATPKAEVEVKEQHTEEIPDNQITYDYDNNIVNIYGKDYTYEGVETDAKGNTTALRVVDANGKVKFIRNENAIVEFEIQKELAENRQLDNVTAEEITKIADENEITSEAKPIEPSEKAAEPVQQERPTEVAPIVKAEEIKVITPEEKRKSLLDELTAELGVEPKVVEPKVEGVAKATEAAPEVPELSTEEVIQQMRPITDEMAKVEMEFSNRGYEIDWDYDNEIQVRDKKTGEMLDVEDLPNDLLTQAGKYEEATSKLGDYDQGAYQQSLDQSRRALQGEEVAYEEVKPVESLLSKEQTPEGKVEGSLRDVELSMRRPDKNEIVFVSVDALLEKHAKDQPSYDIQKPENRIKGRVEKAKEYIKNYIKDQRAINPKTGERMKTKVSFEPSVVDIDANGKISFEDGRHRVLAAKELGLTEVPIEVPKEKVKAAESLLSKEQTPTASKAEITTPKTEEIKAVDTETPGIVNKTPEEIEQEESKLTDRLLAGEAEKRRKDGEYTKDGIVYKRNEKSEGVKGKSGEVRFTNQVAVPFTYKLVEAEELQPSHINGVRNPNHFIPETQPKSRTDQASIQAEDSFAENPRFNELGENTNAYSGAPIINERGEVIQGNNRSAGLKKGYRRGNEKYKNDLANNAEEFGLTKEQVEGMKNPVLVREIKVSDEGAVELGNYDVKDLETGGKRRIDPIAIARRMPFSVKEKLTSLLFGEEGQSLNNAIRKNQKAVIDSISSYLNQAQRSSIIRDGVFTENGVKDLEGLIQQFVFDNGDPALAELFENMSHIQKEGIRKSLPHIFKTSYENSILPEIQNAIMAVNDFNSSGASSFEAWKNQKDMFTGNVPNEFYTPSELAITEMLIKSTNQKQITETIAKYSNLARDKEGDMFNEPTKGMSKKEAIKQIFNAEYNEKTSEAEQGITGSKKAPVRKKVSKVQPEAKPTLEEGLKAIDDAKEATKDFLKKNKIISDGKTKKMGFADPEKVIDKAFDLAKGVYKASFNVNEAIKKAVEHIKTSSWYKSLTSEEKAIAEKTIADQVTSFSEANKRELTLEQEAKTKAFVERKIKTGESVEEVRGMLEEFGLSKEKIDEMMGGAKAEETMPKAEMPKAEEIAPQKETIDKFSELTNFDQQIENASTTAKKKQIEANREKWLNENPSMKDIYANSKEIIKQLEDQGIIKEKKGPCF